MSPGALRQSRVCLLFDGAVAEAVLDAEGVAWARFYCASPGTWMPAGAGQGQAVNYAFGASWSNWILVAADCIDVDVTGITTTSAAAPAVYVFVVRSGGGREAFSLTPAGVAQGIAL